MPNWGTLAIESMIVHEVPLRRARQNVQPILSEIESPLTPDLKNYFKERIVSGLASGSYAVTFDPDAESPVPQLVTDRLANGATLVEASQAMARHLLECQAGSNPPGLLAVGMCGVDQKKAVAIIKLEREAGVRVRQTHIQGRLTFNMEHLADLIFTQKTRLFKIAFFLEDSQGDEVIIRGTVADKQRGIHPTVEVADFFLKAFLGCKLLEAPEVATKTFFTKSQEFISTKVTDPEKQAQYEIALLAAMNSPVAVFNPVTFAQTNLDQDDRQRFRFMLVLMGK